MKQKTVKRNKTALSFAGKDEAFDYLATLTDGRYELEVASGADNSKFFVEALTLRKTKANALRRPDVSFIWRLCGPGLYDIEIAGNEFIPLTSESKAEQIKRLINEMNYGDKLALDPEDDISYIRIIVSKLGSPVYTKKIKNVYYLIKDEKPRSAAAEIRKALESIEGDTGFIQSHKSIEYVRTIVYTMTPEGFRYSIKNCGGGKYEIKKVYFNSPPTQTHSRAFIETVLSPVEIMAYDAILAKLDAAKRLDSVSVPAISETVDVAVDNEPEDVIDWESEFGPDVEDEAPGSVADDFQEITPSWATPPEKNEKPAIAEDPDDYDPKALKMPDVKSIFGEDDEDLEF